MEVVGECGRYHVQSVVECKAEQEEDECAMFTFANTLYCHDLCYISSIVRRVIAGLGNQLVLCLVGVFELVYSIIINNDELPYIVSSNILQ